MIRLKYGYYSEEYYIIFKKTRRYNEILIHSSSSKLKCLNEQILSFLEIVNFLKLINQTKFKNTPLKWWKFWVLDYNREPIVNTELIQGDFFKKCSKCIKLNRRIAIPNLAYKV